MTAESFMSEWEALEDTANRYGCTYSLMRTCNFKGKLTGYRAVLDLENEGGSKFRGDGDTPAEALRACVDLVPVFKASGKKR